MGLVAYSQSQYEQDGWLPAKGNHFVHDYCGILNSADADSIETVLRLFNENTSNQIVVIITPAFGGRDIASFAFEVGNSWGIGQGKLNNGVVIVIKPKDNTDGEAWIATGDGLEGVLPDIFCKRIVEEQMIPHFRDDDYAGGIEAALRVVMPVCAGEYTFEQYQKDTEEGNPILGGIIVAGFIGLCIWSIARKGKGGRWSSGGGSYHGGWSSGHSSSHGGSVFGGGHFSGGGAGGRW